MTRKTKKIYQHFVPKFYLRLFSSNNGSIGTYIFKNELYVKNAPLNSIGGINYLYGEDGNIEDWFSKLEGIWSNVLKKIIQTNSLQIDNDYIELLFFIFLSDARSKAIADINNDFINKMMILTNNLNPKNSKIKFSDKIVKYKIPNYFSITSAVDVIPLMMDLKLVLLVNDTSNQFITSDCFICKYNQFLLNKKHIFGYGYGNIGFQCFIPISPFHCLMLYDSSVYDLKSKKDVFTIHDNEEIDKLNKMFYYNSNEYIFFNNDYDKNKLDILLNDKERLKFDNNIVFKSEDNQYILRFPNRCVKKDFDIKFIKIKKRFNNMKIETNRSAPMRPLTKKMKDIKSEEQIEMLEQLGQKKFFVQKDDK